MENLCYAKNYALQGGDGGDVHSFLWEEAHINSWILFHDEVYRALVFVYGLQRSCHIQLLNIAQPYYDCGCAVEYFRHSETVDECDR